MIRGDKYINGTGISVTESENTSTGRREVTITNTGGTPASIQSGFNSQATPVDLTIDNNFHVVAAVTLTLGGTGDVVCISAALNWIFSIGGGGGQTIHYGISVDSTTAFTGRDCDLAANANTDLGGATLYRTTGLSAGAHTFRLLAHSTGSQAGLTENAVVGDLLVQVA